MLRTARDYLEVLGKDVGNEPGLLRDMAEAYKKLGDIQGNPLHAADLGDSSAAVDSYRQSLAIRRRLVAQGPPIPGDGARLFSVNAEAMEDRCHLAACLGSLGELLLERGELAEARANLKEAMKSFQQLHDAEPFNPRFRANLASAHMDMAELHEWIGDRHAAEEDLYHAETHFMQLCILAPDTGTEADNFSGDLTAVKLCLADHWLHAGRTYQAYRQYFGCQTQYELILRCDPSHARARRAVAVAQLRVAFAMYILGDAAGAVDLYKEALVTLRNLADSDPQNSKTTSIVASCRRELGCVLGAMREPVEALQYLTDSLQAFRRLAREDPTNLRKEYCVAEVLCDVGKTMLARGDAARALEHFLDAIRLASHQVDQSPACIHFRRMLAVAHSRAASACIALGDHAADMHLATARSHFQSVLALDPVHVSYRREWAFLLAHHAEHAFASAPDDAFNLWRQSSDVLRILGEGDVDNAVVRRHYRDLLLRVAKAHIHLASRKGLDPAAALPHWREARQLLTTAFDQHKALFEDENFTFPDAALDPDFHTHLAQCTTALATLKPPSTRPSTASTLPQSPPAAPPETAAN